MAVCLVCGHSHKLAECPICKYEVTFFYGTPTEEEREEEIRRADDYRRSMLGNVKVKLPVYSYIDKIREENHRLIVDEPDQDQIVIEGKDMKLNEPVWFDEEFCGTNRELPLTYEVIDMDGNSKSCSEVFENPGVDGETVNIGLILEPELKMKVILGKGEKYVCSEAYSLK